MDRLEAFLRTNLGAHSWDIAEYAARELSLPPAEVEAAIARLIAAGDLSECRVSGHRELMWRPVYKAAVTSALKDQEDVVWRRHVVPRLRDTPDAPRRLLQYGFTEMLNNVVDHSGGKSVAVVVRRLPEEVELYVEDDGEGIFNKLQRVRGLEDPQHVALELSKGKVTTEPDRHTGEGIFFTARMCDKFLIWSGPVACGHVGSGPWHVEQIEDPPGAIAPVSGVQKGPEWLVKQVEDRPGTTVRMVVRLDTKRTPEQVFDEFAPPDPDPERDRSFAKTSFQASLVLHPGEGLVSRSQAKRLMARCDRFREVTIDFKDIGSIGPAFADEVFRVFQSQHPGLTIRTTNTGPAVERMIQRARGNGSQPPSTD